MSDETVKVVHPGLFSGRRKLDCSFKFGENRFQSLDASKLK